MAHLALPSTRQLWSDDVADNLRAIAFALEDATPEDLQQIRLRIRLWAEELDLFAGSDPLDTEEPRCQTCGQDRDAHERKRRRGWNPSIDNGPDPFPEVCASFTPLHSGSVQHDQGK